MSHQLITTDAWHSLRSATPARIALGRAGGSLPTHEWLAFKSSHAAARDAVHQAFEAESLALEISSLGVETILLNTAAGDRQTFLKRPDLGRRLDAASEQRLRALADPDAAPDLAIIVSDGLSALAVHRQVPPLLAAILPRLNGAGWRMAPIAVVRFGRVALEDQIGQLFGAPARTDADWRTSGPRIAGQLGGVPCLRSARAGNTDANRNCVSNIRPEGLAWNAAADTILYLLTEARHRKLSGVGLKDERLLAAPERLELPDKSSQAS